MSVQNQINMGEGVTLHPLEYRYFTDAAGLVTQLGAQIAELRMTGRGVEFFAANNFKPPRWLFHIIFERPRPEPGRVLVTAPAKITGALYLVGAPRRTSVVKILLGDTGAWVVGSNGMIDIPSRVRMTRNDRSVAPGGVEPLADIDVRRDYFINGILLALARGTRVELKLSPPNGSGWLKLHVLSEANDDYDIIAVKVSKSPDIPIRGLYDAWILTELLLPLRNYITLRFLGNTNHPALHVIWRGILQDPENPVPLTTEFYLEE
ncbi:MAG: hypothetical protein RXR82_06580 [Nitrososphaeria archaeon]